MRFLHLIYVSWLDGWTSELKTCSEHTYTYEHERWQKHPFFFFFFAVIRRLKSKSILFLNCCPKAVIHQTDETKNCGNKTAQGWTTAEIQVQNPNRSHSTYEAKRLELILSYRSKSVAEYLLARRVHRTAQLWRGLSLFFLSWTEEKQLSTY